MKHYGKRNNLKTQPPFWRICIRKRWYWVLAGKRITGIIGIYRMA